MIADMLNTVFIDWDFECYLHTNGFDEDTIVLRAGLLDDSMLHLAYKSDTIDISDGNYIKDAMHLVFEFEKDISRLNEYGNKCGKT